MCTDRCVAHLWVKISVMTNDNYLMANGTMRLVKADGDVVRMCHFCG